MASQRTLRLLLCLTTMLITPILSQESKKAEAMKVSQELQQLVMSVFRGEKLDDLKSSISPGAYVVDGASYESLFESLYGENKSATFASEHNRQMSFLHLTITDDLNCAHLGVCLSNSFTDASEEVHRVLYL